MIRTDMGDITDEEFQNVVVPFDRKVDEYIKNNILNEFIAFYFAEGFHESALWRENVSGIINSACTYLCDYGKEDCDYEIIKSILETKYKLKITNDTELEMKTIED